MCSTSAQTETVCCNISCNISSRSGVPCLHCTSRSSQQRRGRTQMNSFVASRASSPHIPRLSGPWHSRAARPVARIQVVRGFVLLLVDSSQLNEGGCEKAGDPWALRGCLEYTVEPVVSSVPVRTTRRSEEAVMVLRAPRARSC